MVKTEMKNVLVFPCGSMIGLELYKHLAYSNMFKIIGGTSVKDHGSYVYENLIAGLPFIDEEDFLPKLNEAIKINEIDFIFPTSEIGALKFSKWVEDKKILRAEVMTSPYETCRIANSKREIYRIFNGVIPIPRIYHSLEEIEKYPIFLKPEVGTGGLGSYIANTRREVEFYLSKDPSLLIQEYLPGKEYTVDCLTDQKGKLRFAQGRLKSRFFHVRWTGHIERVMDERMPLLADKINQTLDLRGTWFFQLKENEKGNLILLEIAARIEGGTSFQWLNGVNLPLLALCDALGYEIDIKENDYGLEMDRTLWHYRYAINYKYNHIYLSSIESLFLRNQLNYRLLALLYKFRSEGKSISLVISSFKGNKELFKMNLKKHLIPISLFDTIIEIPEGITRSGFLHNQGSIYIDSSLLNRNDVASHTKIPVFDINQVIELFLNW